MSSPLSIAAHVFLPNRCMFCNQVIEHAARLCIDCEKNAPRTDLSSCLICGHKECQCQYYFRWLLSPFYYEMGADTAIRSLKFHNNLENSKKLAFYMAECVKASGLHESIDLIIPAPLYYKDKRKRGYNQAYKLAFQVGRLLNKPVMADILVKIKQTKKQHDLVARDRYLNLTDAFCVYDENKLAIHNKKILLIDDVFTTGTTMNCCAKTLIDAKSSDIIALVAAKTRFSAR